MMIMKPKFVEYIPEKLEDNVLYISIPFRTASHNCICGCGSEIVTPILPNGWIFTYNGESVSLSPSIGNWNLPCKSHYWIKNNNVVIAESWERYSQKSKKKKKFWWNF